MENEPLDPFFRVEKVADYLEALIDPFDLDVFTPHLHGNLNRLVQRTSVSRGEHAHRERERSATGSDYSTDLPNTQCSRTQWGEGLRHRAGLLQGPKRGLDETSGLRQPRDDPFSCE